MWWIYKQALVLLKLQLKQIQIRFLTVFHLSSAHHQSVFSDIFSVSSLLFSSAKSYLAVKKNNQKRKTVRWQTFCSLRWPTGCTPSCGFTPHLSLKTLHRSTCTYRNIPQFPTTLLWIWQGVCHHWPTPAHTASPVFNQVDFYCRILNLLSWRTLDLIYLQLLNYRWLLILYYHKDSKWLFLITDSNMNCGAHDILKMHKKHAT